MLLGAISYFCSYHWVNDLPGAFKQVCILYETTFILYTDMERLCKENLRQKSVCDVMKTAGMITIILITVFVTNLYGGL